MNRAPDRPVAYRLSARGPFALLFLCFWGGALFSLPAPQLSSEILFEGAQRFSGEWDTQRVLGQVSAEISESPWEAKVSAWAWRNFQAGNYSMGAYDLSLRTARFAYWADTWGASAGLGEMHWGETFGLQPTDLINARNYRDFPILDHSRNRIPALLIYGYKAVDTFKFEGFVNPMGALPILPNQLQGREVLQPDRPAYFWTQPEFGVRVGQDLSQGRWSLFAMHHESRVPALVLVPAQLGSAIQNLKWQARYGPVTSVAGSVSYSAGDFVYRLDAVATPSHPCSDGQSEFRCGIYSVVAGTDLAVQAVESLTLGAQWHVDRYPGPDSRAKHGAAVFVRKGLLADRLNAELMGFVGLSLRDRWLRAKTDWSFSKDISVAALAEWIDADPNSALQLFSDLSRVMAQMKVFF